MLIIYTSSRISAAYQQVCQYEYRQQIHDESRLKRHHEFAFSFLIFSPIKYRLRFFPFSEIHVRKRLCNSKYKTLKIKTP